MPAAFEHAQERLTAEPRRWLVTGVGGFIGSHLLEALLQLGQAVTGLDNFATGRRENLDRVRHIVGDEAWGRFELHTGDIRDLDLCRKAVGGARHVLHQAALGSVPRSLQTPTVSTEVNISGFANVLTAAKDEGVASFVYAASSSTYGDSTALPKVEDRIGRPLSPYALTKYVNELYAEVFDRCYGMKATGLRYFNVFGPRQDPNGPYAAVIPKWIGAMQSGEEIVINGDGETSRDFCYVTNVVQANILASLAEPPARGEVYNVAVGGNTSLNTLFAELVRLFAEHGIAYERPPVHGSFRHGDVRHSLADVGKARRLLGYEPTHDFSRGLARTVGSFLASD